MFRRGLMQGGAALTVTSALGVLARAEGRRSGTPAATHGAANAPSEAEWAAFSAQVGGRVAPVTRPDLGDPEVKRLMENPFWLGDQPGLSQSSGWLDSWQAAPSAYVLAAESADDVARAVRFARARGVKLVVRGGGHSYLGGSTAAGSLMIWTRRMRQVTVHEGFTAQGSSASPLPAVSLGAGCIWMDAYKAVTTGAGRYVQGGGCTTVGCAGLVQGGGFGSHSKAYGTAAASLLEAEVVTAEGKVRVVNARRNAELFWALKGGGGGTFGVITRLTLATHPLPDTFGAANMIIRAASDDAYRRLIARFVAFYAEALHNRRWGEQVRARPDNRLGVQMVMNGLSTAEANKVWAPFLQWVRATPADYAFDSPPLILALPARRFWDASFLKTLPVKVIRLDDRPGAAPDDFWWDGDGEQAGAWWRAYQSAWLPASLLAPGEQARLADAWFSASRHATLSLHFNKGLSGATDAVRALSRDTATNPQVVDAFALAITASSEPAFFDGLPADRLPVARVARDRINACMAALRFAAPHAGSYVNECDYHQADWTRAFWGGNYPRLAAAKRRYDPEGIFTVHHGVQA